MNEQTQRNIGWALGALTVLAVVAVYLWISAPEEAILPETYTVM
ncbi:MAG: hypothetical protein P8N28_02450 [Phycisphaerales bacterium]|nr:hypothetical protein [Phycisphaerales bacterium]